MEMPKRYKCYYPSDFNDKMDAFCFAEPDGEWMNAEEILSHLASLSAELAMEKDYASTMREKHDDLEEKYRALKLEFSAAVRGLKAVVAGKDRQINALGVLLGNQKVLLDAARAESGKS